MAGTTRLAYAILMAALLAGCGASGTMGPPDGGGLNRNGNG